MFLSTTGTLNIMHFFIYYRSFVILKLLLIPRETVNFSQAD